MLKASSRVARPRDRYRNMRLAQSISPHPADGNAGETRYDVGILFDHTSSV